MTARFPSRVRAFTVLELLVAMSVLGILLVFVVQLLNSTMAVTAGGNKHMDADSQARQVLDRMAHDLSRIVKRRDVDYSFRKNSGSDQMAFFSEAAGYYPGGVTGALPKSNVSLVGYRINASHQLERLSKGLVWNGVTSSTPGAGGISPADSPMVFLPWTLADTWPDVIGNGGDPDFQVIGDQVYRLEFSFLLKPFTDEKGTAQPSLLSENPWDTRRNHTTPDGLRDVAAVVVTLALLDNRSRALLGDNSADALATAAAKLDDVSGSVIPESPSTLWQAKIASGDLGLPNRSAAAQVRVYQRYFYLNPNL